MFRFSVRTEYALRGIMALAKAGKSLFIKEIAQGENIPQSFLSKLIQQLSKAGLVDARRGRHGGVRLARPKETISILEVIEACEGPLASPTCLLNHTSSCPRPSACPIHEVWQKAQEGMAKVLSKTKLSDLLC